MEIAVPRSALSLISDNVDLWYIGRKYTSCLICGPHWLCHQFGKWVHIPGESVAVNDHVDVTKCSSLTDSRVNDVAS